MVKPNELFVQITYRASVEHCCWGRKQRQKRPGTSLGGQIRAIDGAPPVVLVPETLRLWCEAVAEPTTP